MIIKFQENDATLKMMILTFYIFIYSSLRTEESYDY